MALFGLFNKRKSLNESGLLSGAADSHSHILYGVDDGIKTLDDSLAALKIHEEAGISDVWLTPHIMEDVPNTTERLKERFDQLQDAYNGKLKLHLAAEYMLDNLFEDRLDAEDLLTMGDSVVLVETSTINPPVNFYQTLQTIQRKGYRPMLAHPERYRYLNKDAYDKLQQMGVLFQLNLPSLLGFYGETARSKAETLLAKGAYNRFGTDCHRTIALTELYSRKELSQSVVANLLKLKNDAEKHPVAG